MDTEKLEAGWTVPMF